jgi:hypothetical protein
MQGDVASTRDPQIRCVKASMPVLAFRLATAAMVVVCFVATMARAQQPSSSEPPQSASDASPALSPAPPAARYSSDEVIDAGHHFFGGVSKGIASIVEKAADQWGQPNGYILGEEAGGAFIGGLRYGDGTLYTKDAGDLRVFWQGPTIGVDLGADGARTMMLVYNLPRTNAIYQQFNGIAGAAYFVAGLGMTALTSGDEQMVVVPIRSGLGLRLGYNVGYLKFTAAPTWNPF